MRYGIYRTVAKIFFSVIILISIASITKAQTPVPSAAVTPTVTPGPTFAPTPTPSFDQRLTRLEEQVKALTDEIKHPPKDIWDIIASLSGLISGGIIAAIGIFITQQYNKRQQESSEMHNKREIAVLQVQTVQSFMPQLQSGNEKEIEAALLAIAALGNSKLASDLAELYRTQGAVAALSKLASSADRSVAKHAEDSLKNLFEVLKEAVVQVRGITQGAGFFISPDGYLITAAYIVADRKDNEVKLNISVILQDKTEYNAELVSLNPDVGLALLKIENGQFPTLSISGDLPLVHYLDEIFILGPHPELGWIVASGRVTGTDSKTERYPGQKFIATDAQVTVGFGGSPVINQRREVIGMTIMRYRDHREGLRSMGFLLPIETIQQFIKEAKISEL